ncbi:uncharacterized protein METZ01_LOCUS387561, partial [marine metagenome]
MEYKEREKTSLSWRIPAGMFLMSSAALMYEVSLSRLLAIQIWHHYAFLIISGAMLGYGT